MTDPMRFIDLFAGIGGIRMAVEMVDPSAECVFSSELDPFARETYCHNHHHRDCPGPKKCSDHHFNEDIRHVTSVDDPDVDESVWRQQILDAVPEFDLLLAGFPCQPFSLAGVSKRENMGGDLPPRPHGLEDRIKGTLFQDIARVLKVRQPQVFLLENVKHLKGHNGGDTYRTIIATLKDAGYAVGSRVLDAALVLPQHRERIFIVGMRRPDLPYEDRDLPDAVIDRIMTIPPRERVRLDDILHPDDDPTTPLDDAGWEPRARGGRPKTLSDYVVPAGTWKALVNHRHRHSSSGAGFGYGVVQSPDAVTRTLSARYYKDGAEILIPPAWDYPLPDHPDDVDLYGDDRPRRLTPRECARLQGFPDHFRIPVSDSQAYKQFGNSVPVTLIAEVARNLLTEAGLLDKSQVGPGDVVESRHVLEGAPT